MFIGLTFYYNGEKIYYNVRDIRKFYKGKEFTVLELTNGTSLVKETPEEIMEITRRMYHDVYHFV